MSYIKAILLDLDGTIVDTREGLFCSVARCFLTHDLSPPRYSGVMDKIHRLTLREMVTALLPGNKDRKFADKVALQIENSFINYYIPFYAKPIANALETLTELKRLGFLLP